MIEHPNDEELQKLMEILRAAMDKFLQALAEEMRKNPQQLARPLEHRLIDLPSCRGAVAV